MPSFTKIGGTRTSRQYGEMFTSRTFLYFFEGDFLGSSTEKSTQQFQALNGLKCSTVGNLGSLWAFVIMLLGFTHFFVGQKSKTTKIFELRQIST